MKNQRTFSRPEYNQLLKEEIGEWKRIQSETLEQGIPWWVDLQKATLVGRNLSWRADKDKNNLVRGEEIKKMIDLAVNSGGRVLDLGCGSGWLSLELARRGVSVIGVDASKDRIALAKEIYQQEKKKNRQLGHIEYRVGDINKIDFPEDSFSTIMVWDTLHHFPFLSEILVKCQHWLIPNGKFITFDHIGNDILKLAAKLVSIVRKPSGKIIPYEDSLGEGVINLLRENFQTSTCYTRLSFPVALALEAFLSRDSFKFLLPSVVKFDKLLCNSNLFKGEYFFFYGKNTKSRHR